MEALLRELWQLREIQELAQLMESGGGPALVTGLSPVHRAMTAAALRLKSGAAHGALAMTTPGDTTMVNKKEVEAVMGGAGARVKR